MSDLPKEEQATPEEGHNDPPIKPKNAKSVAVYLVILFAAAFALLLMAYFMQQRSNNEVIGNLQNSVDQFQTVDELRSENEKLRDEVEALEAEMKALEERLNETEGSLSEAEAALSDKEQAYNEEFGLRSDLAAQLACWSDFWDIEYLYRTEQYEACADHIRILGGSSQFEPPAALFVAERCAEIKAALIDLGYLSEEEANRFYAP